MKTKEEKAAYMKLWEAKNRERRLEYKRQYHAEHKDEEKAYAQSRKERTCELARQWRETNKMHKYRYTDSWNSVEGYDRLVADGRDEFHMGKLWVCHHRLEEMGLSMKDLKEMGLYYHRPACELIIMTASEHKKLHDKLRNDAR